MNVIRVKKDKGDEEAILAQDPQNEREAGATMMG